MNDYGDKKIYIFTKTGLTLLKECHIIQSRNGFQIENKTY